MSVHCCKKRVPVSKEYIFKFNKSNTCSSSKTHKSRFIQFPFTKNINFQFLWKMLRQQLIQTGENTMDFQLKAGILTSFDQHSTSRSRSHNDICLLPGNHILSIHTTPFQCSIVVCLFQSLILSSIVRYKVPEPFRPEELNYLLEQKRYTIVTINPKSWRVLFCVNLLITS